MNGIEDLHPSVQYADEMVFFLKPLDDVNKLLKKIREFLAKR